MTFYYASASLCKTVCLAVYSRTVFQMVLKRFEFWFFLILHIALVVLVHLDIVSIATVALKWEAVSAAVFFLSFFITFYSSQCFERFMFAYHQCMHIRDGVLFFAVELVTTLAPPHLEGHRLCAAKYMLALMTVFLRANGGGLRKDDFLEMHRRGLLTKAEAHILQALVGGAMHVVLVLAMWSMQVVDLALQDEVFWTGRALSVPYSHDRMDKHVQSVLKACHEIHDLRAQPIPFQLYHLMNVVLAVDLAALAVVAASMNTFLTVFPMVAGLIFFLGLREVSVHMADPFRGRDMDLPLAAFIQSTFDQVICLIEAFRTPAALKHAKRVAAVARSFTNAQLETTVDYEVLYPPKYNSVLASEYSWNKETPLQTIMERSPDPLAELAAEVVVSGTDVEENTRRSRIFVSERDRWRENLDMRRLFASAGREMSSMLTTTITGGLEGTKTSVKESLRVSREVLKATKRQRRKLSNQLLSVLCCMKVHDNVVEDHVPVRPLQFTLRPWQAAILEREKLEAENEKLEELNSKLLEELEQLRRDCDERLSMTWKSRGPSTRTSHFPGAVLRTASQHSSMRSAWQEDSPAGRQAGARASDKDDLPDFDPVGEEEGVEQPSTLEVMLGHRDRLRQIAPLRVAGLTPTAVELQDRHTPRVNFAVASQHVYPFVYGSC